MKLLNTLYSIKSQDPENRSFTVRLLADSPVFKAHFPGMPIMPGVCIMQTASELLETLLGRHCELSHASNVKFLRVINPAETPEVTFIFRKIEPDETTGLTKVTAEASSAAGVMTKMSLFYKTSIKI